MKKLLVLLLLLPLASLGQSLADYETMMGEFVRYFNDRDVKKIATLFTEESRVFVDHAFKKIDESEGKILSFKYIGDDGADPAVIKVFRVQTTKEIHAMSFSLSTDGKFRTFRHKTSSPEIDSMMAASK